MSSRFGTLLISLAALVMPWQQARGDDASAATQRVGDVTEERIAAEGSAGRHWFINGGSSFGSGHFSPLDLINTKNAKRLGLAWSTQLPTFTMAAEPIARIHIPVRVPYGFHVEWISTSG